MAGKTNKAKNKGKPSNASPSCSDTDLKPVDSAISSNDSTGALENTNADANEAGELSRPATNGTTESKPGDGKEDAEDTSEEVAKKAEG